MQTKLYSVKDMAERFDVSEYVVHKLIKRFKLNGRFIQTKRNTNVMYYPETAFDMIRDTLESNKVVERNYYSTKQVAELAGVTPSCVSNQAKRHNIKSIIQITNRARIAYFSKDDTEKLIEYIHTATDKRYKSEQKKAAAVTVDMAELEALHPLVTDKRCLNFSYWPDVIPKCIEN